MVELLTTGGERKIVRAFGMEKISEEIPFISFNGVKHLFSDEVQKEWERVTSRTVGAIELLVGAEVASIFPDKFETKGELVVMKSSFGSGYTMFGTHPELRVEGVQFSEEVKMVWQMRMKVTTQYANRVQLLQSQYQRTRRIQQGESNQVEKKEGIPPSEIMSF